MEAIGTIRNNTDVDHVADLCDIANGGDVWTIENLHELARQHGLVEESEIRGLEFGMLLALIVESQR